MNAETILTLLARINLVASVAIVLVLALRPLVLGRLGASIAYRFWLVVPIAVAVSFLPAREQVVVVHPPRALQVTEQLSGSAVGELTTAQTASSEMAATPVVSLEALANMLVGFWLLGAGSLFARSIMSTRRFAVDPSFGPALVGVLRPRLVLPADFDTRFGPGERALILAHEGKHRASGHTIVNGIVEVVRCASWFNPLIHLASIQIRTDQELACDAAVIAERPTARRAYAEALLKTQVSSAVLPLGCTWTSRSARRLGERITMLGRPSLGRGGSVAGAAAVAVVGLALGYAAWAQQPERLVTETESLPEAVWTPTADAPEGAISPGLEGERHDLFIERAQEGDIDLVFFGTTETEMWFWQNRGRSVWDQAFGSLNAANFGTQGTQPATLLWRMRNGELAGYQAKLVVLQTVNPGETDASRTRWVASYAPIIAEIRARQPQARILLMAPVPRGGTNLAEWRQRAASDAAVFAQLVDDETVFYFNIGERFYLPDGSFNGETWSSDVNNRGTQRAAFELWAEELQPWLDRFVR